MGKILVEVKNVSKIFRSVRALSNVSFTLGPGITALVGLNGAGKTTLFHIMAGRVQPSEGRMSINGKPPGHYYHKLNILYEDTGFYPHLTARENLQYLNICRGSILSNLEIEQLMVHWDVPRDVHKPFSKYSLGMKKRLGFAASLINSPDFLIMDEPLNGLDIEGQRRLEELFASFREGNKRLIFSTHQMERVVSLADQIIILNQGKLRFSGQLKGIEGTLNLVTARVDKEEIRAYLDEPWIRQAVEEGGFVKLSVERSNVNLLLRLILDKRLQLFQLETLLPSLQEIISMIEEGED